MVIKMEVILGMQTLINTISSGSVRDLMCECVRVCDFTIAVISITISCSRT